MGFVVVDKHIPNKYSGSIMVPYKHVSHVEFEPPLIDDTSYEADALPTKPPRPDGHNTLFM